MEPFGNPVMDRRRLPNAWGAGGRLIVQLRHAPGRSLRSGFSIRMGSLYKPTVLLAVPTSAKIRLEGDVQIASWMTGSRRYQGIVAEGVTPPKARVPQPIWWADWIDGAGNRCRRSTRCREQSLARRWLAEREAEAERERAGLVSREDRRLAFELPRPIPEHLAAFDDSMVAAGRSLSHRRTTRRYIEILAEDLGWTNLRDINRSDMERWLASAERRRVSARSRNGHLVALKSLLNWARKADRIRDNPVGNLPKANERTDPRRRRRALGERDLAALLAAAETRPLQEASIVRRGPRKGQPCITIPIERRERLAAVGAERALAYRALFFTGLRVGELRSIRICDMQLDAPQPCLILSAKSEKARRGATIPLRQDLVEHIRRVHKERQRLGAVQHPAAGGPAVALDPQSPVFVVPSGFLRILNRDLAHAGIAKRSADGRTFDLHAFRTSLGTHLARAGVPLRTTQAVMRHSSPTLTANVYTDTDLLQVDAAVASLPSL